jgi:hypothetical protein
MSIPSSGYSSDARCETAARQQGALTVVEAARRLEV